MNSEGLTSVAVVDNGFNVVGNISTRDLQHLTSVVSFPLLRSSCMHFISVILSERGVEEGRDSFPVFYVNPHSTLAHTVAKLVATRSHRMWVVESASPSPSAPQTPLLTPVQASSSVSSFASNPSQGHTRSPSAGATAAVVANGHHTTNGTGDTHHRQESTVVTPSVSTISATPQSPIPLPASSGSSMPGFASVPAAALPGAHLSGRLTGVVSLTDILNLFARTSGLRPSDPAEIRARRRRSSSQSHSLEFCQAFFAVLACLAANHLLFSRQLCASQPRCLENQYGHAEVMRVRRIGLGLAQPGVTVQGCREPPTENMRA